MHEREQLSIHDLFIDVNMPMYIDETLIGRWISISWFRRSDSQINSGFYAFDIGIISEVVGQNKVKVRFEEEFDSYDVLLQPKNWTSCVISPPTRQYQWRLLRKKASSFIIYAIC